MIDEGKRAPEFQGTLADGQNLRLRDFRDRRHVILYFFPKDFTPGCTREACSFRDRRSEVAELDAEIVGVSLDTPEKHAAFAQAHQLPYPLVSDRDAKIATAYGVSRLGGWLPTKRVTFVIDKQGVVRKVIQSEFSIDRHIDEAIETLRRLQGTAAGDPAQRK
jgi:thioredoxin-dependent peroxiredoxin